MKHLTVYVIMPGEKELWMLIVKSVFNAQGFGQHFPLFFNFVSAVKLYYLVHQGVSEASFERVCDPHVHQQIRW